MMLILWFACVTDICYIINSLHAFCNRQDVYMQKHIEYNKNDNDNKKIHKNLHNTYVFSIESKGYSGISRITDLIKRDITRT